MPQYDTLPPWLRFVGRALRVSGYVLLAVAGVGDLVYPDRGVADGPVGVIVAVALVVLSVVASGGVILHRWRWEWSASFWLAVVVAARAYVTWSSPSPPPPLSSGAFVTFALVALLLRGLDLTVFALRTSAWRVQMMRLGGADVPVPWPLRGR